MTISHNDAADDLRLYTLAAHKSSAGIIREYSTSFGMATRLLGRAIRPHVENIYGLVRIADEVVDGAAGAAGLDVAAQRALLDDLEAETERTLANGYSTNLTVHSFAMTARAVGFGTELTRPFFASMRRDLDPSDFTVEQVRDYIYGSAEVIGLMCLSVFLHGVPCSPEQRARLEAGAQRLGSAFQKINFLRDLSVDWHELHRNYFPTIDPDRLTELQKRELVADIELDLDAAVAVIPELPQNCRVAVAAAHGLFAALTDRVRATPASDLLAIRIRVPNAGKLRIVMAATTRRRVR
ncbi:squalene/phytoene synthase family protein [Cryobacterium sp. CG_9.6]|uniref:phytoene/squalene synthase family protein n=1 Tax=Cryobacterium sp. CG_9.6 TaxID=2760710 RepID=UPI002474736B|nr:squalene/phytoene synthase family protein [Cryobacterium sp. CG_9.6]MDH6237989.1 phytoene/squalene synthetase [Cryobacterium sp. CG_9.6]